MSTPALLDAAARRTSLTKTFEIGLGQAREGFDERFDLSEKSFDEKVSSLLPREDERIRRAIQWR
jgi:hypothetical protein